MSYPAALADNLTRHWARQRGMHKDKSTTALTLSSLHSKIQHMNKTISENNWCMSQHGIVPFATGQHWIKIYGKVSSTRCVIITGTHKFQGQNLVNMRFICTKISRPRHETMLREVMPEFLPYVLPLLCSLLQCDITVNLTSVILIWQLDSGTPICARVSRLKADSLNTNSASNQLSQ